MKSYPSTLELVILLIALGGPKAYADGHDPRKGPTQTRTIYNKTSMIIGFREIWDGKPEKQIIIIYPGYLYQLEIPIKKSLIEFINYQFDWEASLFGFDITSPYFNMCAASGERDTFIVDAPAGQRNYYILQFKSNGFWYVIGKDKKEL